MAKRRRKKKVEEAEDRRAVAVTVAWMLTMIATLMAELLATMAWWLVPTAHAGEAQQPATGILPPFLLFIALVTGVVCLLLTPLVYKFRHTAPPMPVTVVAVIIGSLPLAAVIAFSW